MLLSIPVEMLDHVIGLLDGDVPSLGACSLICRGLLPLCRARLWRHVKLFMGDVTLLQVPRTTALLDILDNDPAIRPFVRSLVIDQFQQCSDMYHPLLQPEDRVSWRTLADRLPCLRSLRLQNFSVRSLYGIISVAGDLPTVESLYVETVCVRRNSLYPYWTSTRALPSTRVSRLQGRWGLRTLSFEDAIVPCEELAELVAFLERSTDYISLDTLDLHWWVSSSSHGSGQSPRWGARPQVPSFGGTLRHFGMTFNDIDSGEVVIPEGRDHIRRVMSGLQICSSLRSLRLEYDRRTAVCTTSASLSDLPENYTATPFFLDLLAETLSNTAATPLPLLEHLSLSFTSPPHWLVGFESAFSRLAEALIGDVEKDTPTCTRRYPRFTRLNVRTSFLTFTAVVFGEDVAKKHRAKQMVDREAILLPMLDRFVKAGVHVEVICD